MMSPLRRGMLLWLGVLCLATLACAFQQGRPRVASGSPWRLSATAVSPSTSDENVISGKSVTKDIMAFFAGGVGGGKGASSAGRDQAFVKRILDDEHRVHIDGMHVITVLFQAARADRKARDFFPPDLMLSKLMSWDREWSERDISTFVYGIRSLECVDDKDAELLKLAASKITSSSAALSSRAIGNALYGLQSITSDTRGVPEICQSLAAKIALFQGDLNGQDIGIGLYGLQGMSADSPEVRQLVSVLSQKIARSEAELDAQALSNSLYGLQSMSSEYPEVLALVAALATKVAESQAELGAQSLGSALYGLQKLSSDALEVRTLVAALSEKVEISKQGLDAQAIGNALFGLQRMKSNTAEVRALVQALATKMVELRVEMDSKGIGSSLYGLCSMSDDQPQVRALLGALAERIDKSDSVLSGQGIADALYGLRGMTSDCVELRALLTSLAKRIDSSQGKLDSQEIGNALYGLQGMSSEMVEVRVIVKKLAEKLRRSKALLRSQHIGRALLGLQRLSADSSEVRLLLREVTKRIADSDRARMTSSAIADALYGLQGMSENVPEVQELIGELAKKISSTAAELSPDEAGRALFGLQGMSSQASIFAESAIGIDSDEVQFLLGALWDKIKGMREQWSLGAVALGMQGLTLLKDPLAENLRKFMYLQTIRLGETIEAEGGSIVVESPTPELAMDTISAVRALRLNGLLVPRWLAERYNAIEQAHALKAIVPQSRADKLIVSRYAQQYPQERMVPNSLVDGIRLDMDFPDLKLNFELDGPSHKYPARARFDRARDEYLAVKKGYRVIRLPLYDSSVDAIVKAVHAEVTRTVDAVEDGKIQRIYASEQQIQRIYTPRR